MYTKKSIVFALALFYLALLLLGNGNYRLFDWDEINFAESSREMIASGNYARVQINFQPFWEKPPLFFWMQSLCMHAFGINEWAARLPNVVFTFLSVLTVFSIGRRLNGERVGFLWALIFGCSLLPFFYGKSGIIDPVFNYFIFLSVFQWYLSTESTVSSDKTKHAAIAGLFSGLAVLTKGPVAVLLVMLSVAMVWIFAMRRKNIQLKQLFLYGVAVVLVSLAWFGPEMLMNGPWFIQEFIQYQIRLFSTPDAGHGQPFYYHFLVVMLFCFPAGVWAASELFKRSYQTRHFGPWMLALFWVVMVLFSMVTTKIVHYSSMCYLPLSYLAAVGIDKLWLKGNLRIGQLIWQLVFTTILGLGILLIPLIDKALKNSADGISDPFAKSQTLADAGWQWYDGWPGLIVLVSIPVLLVFYRKRYIYEFIIISTFSLVLMLTCLTFTIIPKIEKYTQGAYIDFLTNLKGKDVYVVTGDFKSYAQYFYFQKPGLSQAEMAASFDKSWYKTGDIDKPVYFIYRNKNAQEAEAIPDIEKLYEKNGYVFYLRKPVTPLVNTGQE